jgi:hypothetical protein
MKLPRVLIAVITYDGKDYCYDKFKRHAKAINYPNKEFLFVDNSKSHKYAEKLRKDWDNVIRSKRGNNARESLARGQEIAKRYMQENDFDYLLFLESDMMVPHDIVQKLMKHGKQVCGVYYEIGYENYRVPCITIVIITESGTKGTRRLKPEEISDYQNKGLKQVAHCGLGCTLIRKEVFEGITFKYIPDLRGYSDIFFANDINNKGISVWCEKLPKYWELQKEKRKFHVRWETKKAEAAIEGYEKLIAQHDESIARLEKQLEEARKNLEE